MDDLSTRSQGRLVIVVVVLILIALFVSVRWAGAAVLKGKQRVRWLNAFDSIKAFVRSRDGWFIITMIILGIGLIIGIVATILLESPTS